MLDLLFTYSLKSVPNQIDTFDLALNNTSKYIQIVTFIICLFSNRSVFSYFCTIFFILNYVIF